MSQQQAVLSASFYLRAYSQLETDSQPADAKVLRYLGLGFTRQPLRTVKLGSNKQDVGWRPLTTLISAGAEKMEWNLSLFEQLADVA